MGGFVGGHNLPEDMVVVDVGGCFVDADSLPVNHIPRHPRCHFICGIYVSDKEAF